MALHDPEQSLDGDSLIRVGGAVMAAARERPDLGLMLARDASQPCATHWYVDTRVSTAPDREPDIRFPADAPPPLRDLAARVDSGDFGQWVGDVRDGVDTGRLHAIVALRSATAELPHARAPRNAAPLPQPSPSRTIEVGLEAVPAATIRSHRARH